MIELFLHLAPTRSVGTLHVGQWKYIQKGLERNVQKVQQFYRTHNVTVASEHFLVRLLESLPVPQRLDSERYYDAVDRVALNHAQLMGMTSPQSQGRVFRGTFYGGKTPEYLLATDDYFDYRAVEADWMNAQPIKPLMHPKSDLSFQLLNGKPYSAEEGLAVIQINIPMLAVMHRAFVNSEKLRSSNPRTTMMFIASYVIPNMLQAHAELAIFNRIYNDATRPELGQSEPFRGHAFAMPKYDFMVDNAIEQALEFIQRSPQDFQTILKTMPAIFHDSQWEALKMPDVLPTYQVDWLLTITRLKAVDLLFKLARPELLAKNQKTVNQILRAMRRNNVINILEADLPVDVEREVRRYTDTVLSGAERDFF